SMPGLSSSRRVSNRCPRKPSARNVMRLCRLCTGGPNVLSSVVSSKKGHNLPTMDITIACTRHDWINSLSNSERVNYGSLLRRSQQKTWLIVSPTCGRISNEPTAAPTQLCTGLHWVPHSSHGHAWCDDARTVHRIPS